ncbi:MAG: DUF2975 domain-containing protein [Candidatus Symbiothrix sp.]|jgi:hypothetical protein|nr:DUF2975 domain-containing protein [Candidatus Symbiothrix sp.]
MNTRLKIICVLLGITYLFVCFHIISSSVSISIENSEEESTVSQNDSHNGTQYFFHIQPKGKEIFPIQLKNQKTGTIINCSTNYLKVKIDSPGNFWFISLLIFSIAILFITCYIPIITYKLIKSMVKNNIFETINIQRIRKIGYSLIIFFLIGVLIDFIQMTVVKELVELENYKIVFSINGVYIHLLFGLVILLFGEILQISLKMKEEVDLTV